MKGLQYALRCLTLLGLTALAAPSEPVYPYAPSLKLVDFTSWIRQQGQFDRGFLKATPRGFAWPDGTRARFWGVNIANRNLWVERTEIDRAVQVLAASGVNLVRFEALDSKGALLDIPDQPGTRKLNPERLDTLHYWIMRLREKGIYYYLDLIDFREFRAEDGVQNADQLPRAGRPYAVFDPRLIELQKEYARQLLTTVNPYTRLAPTEDPALVLLEICNESGFWLYPDKAAYASLAAHMSIWRATAFHFHEYLVMGVLVMLAVVLWSAVSGKPGERFDWSYLALNGLLAALYTVYLRTTFYWPAFFICSTLYQLYLLQQRPHQGRADSDSLTDFFFVGSHLLAVRFYYGSLDQLAQWLKASPEQSVKLLAAIGFALQAGLLTLYVWIRLKAQQSESDPPRQGLSVLEPRGWLTTLALVATLFLSSRACYESIFLPYSSSWFGFGITYWNPVDEVEFLKKYHPDLDRIINDYDSGGYLLWMLYPKTKVMIDPRSFPYRKFWADYIQYERGQIGLNFLDRFGKTPEVSIVSLKNDKLWRSFLFDSKNWVPAWCGTAYVIFVKRGFTYPPDAVDFMPERFETLRNAQKAMQIYRFAIEANAFELAWKVLDVMTRKFNTTPEEKRLVQNLEAYKECLLAIQAKDFERATRAQENCYRLGMFVNANLLMELYKQQLVQLKQAGKKTSDPEMRTLLEKAQRLSEGRDLNIAP